MSINFKKSFFENINDGRKSAVIVPSFLGFLFSAASRFTQTDGQFKPYDIAFLFTGFLYGLLFLVLFLIFEKGIAVLARKSVSMKSSHGDDGALPQFIAPSWSGMKRYVCITALCWMLTYLLLFPGIVVGDTAVQIEQYMSQNTALPKMSFARRTSRRGTFDLPGTSVLPGSFFLTLIIICCHPLCIDYSANGGNVDVARTSRRSSPKRMQPHPDSKKARVLKPSTRAPI